MYHYRFQAPLTASYPSRIHLVAVRRQISVIDSSVPSKHQAKPISRENTRVSKNRGGPAGPLQYTDAIFAVAIAVERPE